MEDCCRSRRYSRGRAGCRHFGIYENGNSIVSEEAGTVMKINVQEGDFVNEGDVLLEIE